MNDQGFDIVEDMYERNLLKDDEQVILADGFENAIVGITASNPKQVIYDFWKCINIIIKASKNKMDFNEAMDWLEDYISETTEDDELRIIAPIFMKKV